MPTKPIPTFKSSLPQEFLAGLDERGRFLYTKTDEAAQMNAWLLQETMAQSAILEEVKVQTEKTNGRLLVAEKDIKEIKVEQVAINDNLATLTFVKKLTKSRWFWIGVAVFVFVILPTLTSHAPTPAQIVEKVWSGLFG